MTSIHNVKRFEQQKNIKKSNPFYFVFCPLYHFVHAEQDVFVLFFLCVCWGSFSFCFFFCSLLFGKSHQTLAVVLIFCLLPVICVDVFFSNLNYFKWCSSYFVEVFEITKRVLEILNYNKATNSHLLHGIQHGVGIRYFHLSWHFLLEIQLHVTVFSIQRESLRSYTQSLGRRIKGFAAQTRRKRRVEVL